MIHDAISSHESGILSMSVFIKHMELTRSSPTRPLSFHPHKADGDGGELPTLKQATNRLIEEALKRTGGNQGAAARLLGVSRRTVNKYWQGMKGEKTG
jgi:DNA-binding NtrC family response regulator